MPSIQNTIIEFNFTLLLGVYIRIKQSRQEDIM